MITNKKIDRVTRLYEFLREYQKVKSPVATTIEDAAWHRFFDKPLKIEQGESIQTVYKEVEPEYFEALYSLYARLRKEPETIELVYGDLYVEALHDTTKRHPVLLQTLTVEFDARTQAFQLIVADKLPELYQTYLGGLEGIDEGKMTALFSAFKAMPKSPLEQGEYEEVSGQLQACIPDTAYTVRQQPVLFLRKRYQGVGPAIDAIIEDIMKGKEIPAFIADIVGQGDTARKGQKAKEVLKKLAIDANGMDQKVLFTKPANKEQLLVAKHLERHEAVLVQGPPGTGKTHTIANMIGHFLAQGKSILVTSYSEKALRVVKHQVAEPLQSLCVSVLGDVESRQELESSLEAIQLKRATLERSELTRRVVLNEKNRDACIKTREKLKAEVKTIHLNEYTPLKVAGKMYKPVEAAHYVAQHRAEAAWLPGPVRAGTALPLTEEKIKWLYETKEKLTAEDDILCGWEMDEMRLMKPEAFVHWLQEEKKYKAKQKPEWMGYFKSEVADHTQDVRAHLQTTLTAAAHTIRTEARWCLEALAAGKDDKTREKWQSLINDVRELYQLSTTYADALLTYEPSVTLQDDHIKPLDVYSDINQRLQGGGKLSRITLFLNPQMKTVIEASRVNGRVPETMAEFEVLIHYMVLKEKREALKLRWERQMVPLGAETIEQMGEHFEGGCQKYCEMLTKYLDWYKKTWQPLTKQLETYGVAVQELMALQSFSTDETSEIAYIKETLIPGIQAVLSYESETVARDSLYEEKTLLEQCITTYPAYTESPILVGLKMALKTGDTVHYEMYYEAYLDRKKMQHTLSERKELLEKLSFAAPEWATYLSKAYEEGEERVVPVKIEEAWLCRQLSELLDKRHERTIEGIKEELAEVDQRLHYYTMHLTHDKAWLHKLMDFDANRSEVQAIEGWKQLMAKMGAGRGKQVEVLKAEARKLMPKCQKAVPAWIMPLGKVVEQFDPRENKFDVVIIDEASQADMTALIALYLGKQVLIVGDDEQVSPLAIGERGEDLERLVKMYLEDIPHHYLYSGRFSIYDLAQLSGYQPVRLREHFRCVPEIIGYCNQLAYKGQIQPLRPSHEAMLKPAIRTHRIEGACESSQTNLKEAQYIVDTILDCCKNPVYEGKTFGVISLKGDKQANLIDQMLQKEMHTTAYTKRRILCGNPSHFQGDERDVLFITFVDVPTGTTGLRLLTYGNDNRYKKRYNVAMSRGRDQVILVHSFDVDNDLKAEDMRTELFAYCKDSAQESSATEKLYKEPLSAFEAHIQTQLEAHGYKVQAHASNGMLMTSMTVEKDKKYVRLICESDKWQEESELDEAIEAQMVLERIGWQFVYVSATYYYLDEQKGLERLIAQLEAKFEMV